MVEGGPWGPSGSLYCWEPHPTSALGHHISLSLCFSFTVTLPCSYPQRLGCEGHTPGMMTQKSRGDKGKVSQEFLDKGVTFSASSSWAVGKTVRRGLELLPLWMPQLCPPAPHLTEPPSPTENGVLAPHHS
jgi:hypothetical protein